MGTDLFGANENARLKTGRKVVEMAKGKDPLVEVIFAEAEMTLFAAMGLTKFDVIFVRNLFDNTMPSMDGVLEKANEMHINPQSLTAALAMMAMYFARLGLAGLPQLTLNEQIAASDKDGPINLRDPR
jgi:hypothetical protein